MRVVFIVLSNNWIVTWCQKWLSLRRMATICKPPEPLSLCGNVSQNWKDFEEQLTWFLEGTESSDKSDMAKIGIMLSHAGKEAREVYKTLQWTTDGDEKKFNKVIEAFCMYCSLCKHILYKRYTFWSLQQEGEESVDAYLTRIKLKLDTCEYAAEVRQDMTRDKFVFGLTDDNLKERLLREENLDLATAVGLAQRAESSKRQIREMTTHHEVNVVQRSRGRSSMFTETAHCGNCGRQHKPKLCPAYGQRCTFCHKLNHFSRVCHSRRIAPQQKSAQMDSRMSSTSRRVHEIENNDIVSNSSGEESHELSLNLSELMVLRNRQHGLLISIPVEAKYALSLTQ